MSASVCASCLSRLQISTPTTSRLPSYILPFTSSFSTTATQQRSSVLKKKTGPVQQNQLPKFRVSRGTRLSKKQKDRPKPPAPGERRAQRKRIVLSNTNALQVHDLEFLSVDNMADVSKVGQMLALKGETLDQLRECKSFKTTQNWNMFRQPSTLVRTETIELAKDIEDVTASRQDQGFGAVTVQKIITGERGAGKSIHLLQAQSMAFLRDWVVVTIPECHDFVINTSSYSPAPAEETQQTSSAEQPQTQYYNQPQLTAQLLARIATANRRILQSLKFNHQHPKSLPFKTTKSANLLALAEAGANDPTIAVPVFNAFWKELTQLPTTASSSASTSSKGTQRPPVLITLDGLNHWMGPTLYRSSDYKIVHAHQFKLIRHFLSLLFPQENKNLLPSGGLVLAATTASNNPTVPNFDILLRQIEALQSGMKPNDNAFPLPTPYSKADGAVLELAQNAQMVSVSKLKGLSRPESKGLLEYFARSGILREKITEVFVGEKWSLSGGGVIGELAKLSSRVRV